MKKKVKRYEDGGDVSLEQKYPGAKITKGEYQGKPDPKLSDTESAKTMREMREAADRKYIAKEATPEYERKAEKFESTKPRGGGLRGSGGGGGVVPIDKMLKMNKMYYKKGGSVSSASSRADGCAIRGKTRA